MYFIRIIFNKIIFYEYFIKIHFLLNFTMTSKDLIENFEKFFLSFLVFIESFCFLY